MNPGCTKCSRRAFCRNLLPAGLLLGLFPMRAQAKKTGKKIAIPLKKVPDLKKKLGGKLVRVKGRAILLIRAGDDKVVAIDPVCTHKACDVLYRKKWGEIRCDCHGSTYDLNGHVTNPPAVQNLSTYPAKLEKDRIVVELRLVPGKVVGKAEEEEDETMEEREDKAKDGKTDSD